MKLDSISKKAFHLFLHLVISLMLIDWAVQLPLSFHGIGLFEISFVLLGIFSLIRLYFEKGGVFRNVWKVLRASKWTALALSGYLVMGIITLFYAQSPRYALSKYVVVVQMLFLGACLLYYISTCQKGSGAAMRSIYVTIGLSTVFAAVWGILKFLLYRNTADSVSISPITDYNQYTTILLIGLICIGFYIISSSLHTAVKYSFAAISFAIISATIAASKSRRSYLLLFPILAFLFVYAIIYEVRRFTKDGKSKRQLISGLCGVLFCALCVYAASNILTQIVVYPSNHASESYEISDVSLSDTPLSDKPFSLTLLSDTSAPQKTDFTAQDRLNVSNGIGIRSIIWNAALNELAQYDAFSLIFGKGASYHSDLYDNVNLPAMEQLRLAYGFSDTYTPPKNWMNPHNLFLQDLLNGGIILLLLQLSVILTCAGYIILLLRKNTAIGCSLGLMFSVLLVTLLLSCGPGIIANKFFWLLITFLMAEVFSIKSTGLQTL